MRDDGDADETALPFYASGGEQAGSQGWEMETEGGERVDEGLGIEGCYEEEEEVAYDERYFGRETVFGLQTVLEMDEEEMDEGYV